MDSSQGNLLNLPCHGHQQQQQPAYGGYTQAPPAQAFGAAPYGQPQQPNPDAELWSWFQAVDRDKTGKITVTELQAALTNANWTSFNAETCRLMIAMFDTDHNGTISFDEFRGLWRYVQEWRQVFNKFDTDRTGVINAQELGIAVSQMGFRLSSQFVNLIIARFDPQSRRGLKMDMFIQVCVLLKQLTDAFRNRDTQQAGTIRIGYEDFMSMVVLNKP
ncbi:uncharacterized protein TRIADDRAFT_28496 [Trichoplax adhaerens]|uniref:EF-hand domain-containing protein n=1 Tax=Trichoplax adhaerens TaxID=10228 RepID=B3S424_TRIAD|nr:hypothetical protein TRIADDRAFT_28496 [Trichoplax adhaerens]EDV22565.1 hypothetical protein TRIADDRAFT_28496 [Trichoplax adhaerens]|eukprot:XP_002115109.1 hypothetical protein TRIADDRAFT_28496 [Trichoplax adhaerens]